MKTYHDIFIYTFNGLCLPPRLPFDAREITRDEPAWLKGFDLFWRWVNPLNRYDPSAEVARLIVNRPQETQGEILQQWIHAFHDVPDIRFVVLPVDFDFMEAGEPLTSYTTQLYELVKLKQQYPEKVLPFVAVDPRRAQGEALVDFVRPYIEDRGFAGIKLYPAAGFYPFDPALYALYKFAEDHEVPVVAQGGTGCGTFQGRITEQHRNPLDFSTVREYRERQYNDNKDPGEKHDAEGGDAAEEKYKTKVNRKYELNDLLEMARLHLDPLLKVRDKDQIKACFSAPGYFVQVLTAFPNLKLCLSGYQGTDGRWEEFIHSATAMENLNVYAGVTPLGSKKMDRISVSRRIAGISPLQPWRGGIFGNRHDPACAQEYGRVLFNEISSEASNRFLANEYSTPQKL